MTKVIIRFFPLLLIFSMVCSLPHYVVAQEDSCAFSIQGKVLDIETKEPIPFVFVKVKDVNKFSQTDLNGDFIIKGLCSPENTIIISCIGYGNSVHKQHPQHVKMTRIFLKQEVLQLGTVVVKAEKRREEGTIAVAQTTLRREALHRDPSQSLAAALTQVEGVTLTSNGSNVQLPVIHGLYGNRILILNNGLKHGFQNWGTDHAAEIDIASAHSVTVLKGAAGVRFGPEALGGAIIVESNPLHLKEPFFTSLGSGYQTNGKGVFSTIELGEGFNKWSYSLGGNYTKIGDRHTPNYMLTNSGKVETSINGGVHYHPEKWSFKLQFSFVDQNLALLRSSVAESGNAFIKALNSEEPSITKPFSYEINEPNQLTSHYLAKAEIDWWYADNAKLTLRLGKQLNRREEYDVRRNAEKPIIDLDLLTDDYQLEWTHPNWKNLEGLIGLQMLVQDNNNNPGTGTTAFIPNYNTIRYSGFMIESLRKGKNTFEAGVRVDYENNKVRGRETNQAIFRDDYSFTNLTSSFGYIRELSENSTFRTNIGTAWRTPNMAELYSFGQHGFRTSFGLLRYYFNEEGSLRTDQVIEIDAGDIEPEKGFKWINEWHTQTKTSDYTFTFYSHYLQNFIFNRPVAVLGTIRGPMPFFIFDQADALFIGSDFTWQKNWTKSLSGSYSLSYLWSRNLKKNEALINQPPITTNYKLTWHTRDFWKVTGSKISINPSYTFMQNQAPRTVSPEALIEGSVPISADSEIFDFKAAPEGYFLTDVSWAFRVKSVTASFAVRNVFNTSYRNYLNQMRYFADELGRNFLFTINYTINKTE
ncbi:MAG: iron complex outermembrane receptor protein [Marivirga sp.]|jgi:iron complex outermembrane receptor protein